VSLESYLESLREGEFSDPGEFTIAAERARALLAGRALADPWAAWLCLAQGLIALGTDGLEIDITRRAVIWRTSLRLPLEELLRHERFLLGWLNLGWFGSPHWSATEGTLCVEWRGHAWHRYRLAASMRSQLQRGLVYCPVPVKLGAINIVQTHLPVGCPLCLYPLPEGRAGGLRLADAAGGTPGFFERRRFLLLDQPETDPRLLAAFASKTRASWSEVTWVHHGTVIAHERNFMDRPGVSVVASVEALELETDLSGFSVITNQAYFRFRDQLKQNVLWML
jgi:hypothetical protein